MACAEPNNEEVRYLIGNNHWGIRLASCSGVDVRSNMLRDNYIDFEDNNQTYNQFTEGSLFDQWADDRTIALSVVVVGEVLLALGAFRTVRRRGGRYGTPNSKEEA